MDGVVERAVSWGWDCIEGVSWGWDCMEGSVLRMELYRGECAMDGAV